MTLDQLSFALRVVAAAGLVFWLLVVLDRRRWWPLQWSLHLEAAAQQPAAPGHEDLVVVIPARNEAATLPRTLPRLLKQSAWYRRIVVVDDRSVDHTASTARRLATGTAAAEKMRVVTAKQPPADWRGKPHALKTGLEVAFEGWTGDPAHQWVLFTDADILHPTSSISRLVAQAERGSYDMVSVMVKLRARGFWEWVLIPPFVYFFQLLYPFRKVSDRKYRVAAAAGGCLLVRRSMLDEVGGIASIKNRLIDDIALARRLKAAGARCWLGLDPDMQSTRSYVSMGEIVRMIARSAFEQVGHRYAMVPLVWLALLVLFTAPPLLIVYGALVADPWVAVPALVSTLLQWANFLPVVQYLEAPSGFSLTLPLAAVFYGCTTTLSAWRQLVGKRVPWRDNVEVDSTGE